jgi:hypothetical protein
MPAQALTFGTRFEHWRFGILVFATAQAGWIMRRN